MKIHEYQARELLLEFGIPVPPAHLVRSAHEAGAAFEKLVADHAVALAVVKAQVHVGGRGKGGGVRLVTTAGDAQNAAEEIFDKPLVTPQTGPAGVPVRKLLVAAGVEIEKEFYVGMAVDRVNSCPVLIASNEGGVEIEQVARDNADAIVRVPVDPVTGLHPYQSRHVAYRLGFRNGQVRAATAIMTQLSRLFLESDASLAEINPLVLTRSGPNDPEGRIVAIDAKINFDDNALFRHEEIVKLADPDEENPAEKRAAEFGLSYIKLDGNIGCLVNGAGLAMATMDLIKLHGSEPANFLDVGGSASEEAVTEAFRIILADRNVQGVLVNIFGGIAKCDTIARAIVHAAQEVGFKVPLVVRLEGTNVKAARKILEEAATIIPTMQTSVDLTDAARPITPTFLANVTLNTGLLTILLSWLLFVLVFLASGQAFELPTLLATTFNAELGPSQTIAVCSLVCLLVFGVTWAALSLSSAAALSGRSGIIAAMACLPVVICLLPIPIFILDQKLPGLTETLWTVLCLIVGGGILSGGFWAFHTAYYQKLITGAAVAFSLGIWLLIIAACLLISLLYGADGSLGLSLLPPHVTLLLTALAALPAMPIALAPLAINWSWQR